MNNYPISNSCPSKQNKNDTQMAVKNYNERKERNKKLKKKELIRTSTTGFATTS